MSQLVRVLPEHLFELRAASTASGGTALTTTAGLISIPFGSDYLSVTGRNFAEAVVVRWLLNPYLRIIYTTDLLTSPGVSDLSDEMQDGDDTDNNFLSWDTLANGHALYVGAEVPFRGCAVDIGTTPNAVAASVLTIKYWNGGAWVDTANSEDTTSGGICLAVDGNETWTIASAWKSASLVKTGDTLRTGDILSVPLYWTRWEVDKAMTANMDIIQLRALNRSTAYAEYIEGQTVEVGLQDRRVACIEALTNAGTANLVVNVGAQAADVFE